MRILIQTLLASAALATLAPASVAASRLQRVLDSGELRVCIWPDYYGVTFRNPKTRQLSGIDIDISSALAQDLGVRLRYVDSSFPALADNLLNDQCDIAMHAVGVTPARMAAVSFTQPYLRSDIYAITNASNSSIRHWSDLDKSGRVIAVQAGTVMEPVMRQTLMHARLLVVKPPMTRETAVESGRADAFMTDFPYSQRMLATTDWARLIVPPRPFHMTDYAYALAPGDSSLLTRVNRFITAMKNDKRLLQFARRHKLEPIVVTDPGGADAGNQER